MAGKKGGRSNEFPIYSPHMDVVVLRRLRDAGNHPIHFNHMELDEVSRCDQREPALSGAVERAGLHIPVLLRMVCVRCRSAAREFA